MADKDLKEILRGAGREIAVTQMAAACETAGNKAVMKNQLDVLHYAAVHVIATRIYNGVVQDKLDAKMLMAMVRAELERELHFLIDTPKEGMEISRPQGVLLAGHPRLGLRALTRALLPRVPLLPLRRLQRRVHLDRGPELRRASPDPPLGHLARDLGKREALGCI